jgi:hypothetical protein
MITMTQVRPIHRFILAVDIEGSTTRTNVGRAHIRQVMYDLVEEALDAAGITEAHRDPLIDRGDGVLVLIQPVDHLPVTLLLDTVIPGLSGLLVKHNNRHDRLRLRAVVHEGAVHYDRRGTFGEALDTAFRLLDARELKRKLSDTPAASMVLGVSDELYRAVVVQGYAGIDPDAFADPVHFRIDDRRRSGRMHVPAAAFRPGTGVIDLDRRRRSRIAE